MPTVGLADDQSTRPIRFAHRTASPTLEVGPTRRNDASVWPFTAEAQSLWRSGGCRDHRVHEADRRFDASPDGRQLGDAEPPGMTMGAVVKRSEQRKEVVNVLSDRISDAVADGAGGAFGSGALRRWRLAARRVSARREIVGECELRSTTERPRTCGPSWMPSMTCSLNSSRCTHRLRRRRSPAGPRSRVAKRRRGNWPLRSPGSPDPPQKPSRSAARTSTTKPPGTWQTQATNPIVVWSTMLTDKAMLDPHPRSPPRRLPRTARRTGDRPHRSLYCMNGTMIL